MLTLLLSTAPAHGQSQTFVVDSLADVNDGDFSAGNLTLREAIGLANATTEADVITFDPTLAGATILLTEGQLEISSSMTIDGLGADALTVSAGGASRVIAEVGNGPRIITLRDLTLADGFAPAGGGGALFTNGGNITLERVVMRNNNSLLVSGSTIVAAFGTLDIKECAIVDNLNTGVGAVRLQDNQTTIVNTTISNNQTAAISFFSAFETGGDFLSLTNVTISGNGGSSGIEIVANAGTMDFEYQNTIFADNGSANIFARGDALAGLTITSLGNNLLDDSPAGAAAHGAAAGDLRDTDPLLASLGDYGGATFTMRPQPHSPAIDAARCFADDPLVPEDDQRGVARPQGQSCDIGAVELATSDEEVFSDGFE